MPKLRGSAKAKFLARMAAGRRRAKKHAAPRRHARRDPSAHTKGIAKRMLAGITSGLWLPNWANAMEEMGERLPHHITDESAPKPPASLKRLALEFAYALARMNHGGLHDIFDRASIAEGRLVDAEKLGYYLAMQAQGHGVSWFDDHEHFDVTIPYVEAYAEKYGRGWDVSGSVGSGGRKAR